MLGNCTERKKLTKNSERKIRYLPWRETPEVETGGQRDMNEAGSGAPERETQGETQMIE